jgi:FkbM family methyltransferase
MLRSAARFISGRLLPRAPYPVLAGPLKGCRIVLGSLAGEGGGASVYFNAVEPEQTRALVELLQPGHVFFDVGANVGYYTLLASRRVGDAGKVVAIEPLERNLAYLRRHLAINDVRNVQIVPEAVADRVGETCFEAGVNPAEGHIVQAGDGAEPARGAKSSECAGPASGTPSSINTAVTVPMTTLDRLVERLELVPHVVKMDIEGAEYLALLGASRTLGHSKPALLLSVHSASLREQCTALLRQHGYRFQQLAPMEFLARAD